MMIRPISALCFLTLSIYTSWVIKFVNEEKKIESCDILKYMRTKRNIASEIINLTLVTRSNRCKSGRATTI